MNQMGVKNKLFSLEALDIIQAKSYYFNTKSIPITAETIPQFQKISGIKYSDSNSNCNSNSNNDESEEFTLSFPQIYNLCNAILDWFFERWCVNYEINDPKNLAEYFNTAQWESDRYEPELIPLIEYLVSLFLSLQRYAHNSIAF